MAEPPSPGEIAAHIMRRLEAERDPARAGAEKRYLKSSLQFLGTGIPAIRATVTDVRRHCPALPREAVLEVAHALWNTPIHEYRMATVELLDSFRPVLEPHDLELVELLGREAGTWALVDPLAVSIAGNLVERFPELAATLDRWSTDPDFWIRRMALLTLLPPLRRGEGDVKRFTRYADLMLDEREFFIRKAIGWVLRIVAIPVANRLLVVKAVIRPARAGRRPAPISRPPRRLRRTW
jgi:3-methyladenine DNA glycosylase AlkD